MLWADHRPPHPAAPRSGITITLHCDFRGRTVDFAQGRSDVNLIASRAIVLRRGETTWSCPGIGNNPRLLRQAATAQRDLRRVVAFFFLFPRFLPRRSTQRLISPCGFLGVKRGDDGTEIGAIELGIFGDFAS